MMLGEDLVHNRHPIFISIPSASSLRSELQSEHQLQQPYTFDFPSSPRALPKCHTQTNCNHLQLCQQVLKTEWENKWMHQMSSEGYTNGGYCHNLKVVKVFRFLVNSSSPGPLFQILLTLLVPSAPSNQFKDSNVAHPFPAFPCPPPFLPVMPGWFLKRMRMALKKQNEFT